MRTVSILNQLERGGLHQTSPDSPQWRGRTVPFMTRVPVHRTRTSTRHAFPGRENRSMQRSKSRAGCDDDVVGMSTANMRPTNPRTAVRRTLTPPVSDSVTEWTLAGSTRFPGHASAMARSTSSWLRSIASDLVPRVQVRLRWGAPALSWRTWTAVTSAASVAGTNVPGMGTSPGRIEDAISPGRCAKSAEPSAPAHGGRSGGPMSTAPNATDSCMTASMGSGDPVRAQRQRCGDRADLTLESLALRHRSTRPRISS